MKRIYIIRLFVVVTLFSTLTLTSCIKEDIFGLSDGCEVKKVFLIGQDESEIKLYEGTETAPDSILVTLQSDYPDFETFFWEFKTSSLATVAPDPMELYNFSKPIKFVITSESGRYSRIVWVKVTKEENIFDFD